MKLANQTATFKSAPTCTQRSQEEWSLAMSEQEQDRGPADPLLSILLVADARYDASYVSIPSSFSGLATLRSLRSLAFFCVLVLVLVLLLLLLQPLYPIAFVLASAALPSPAALHICVPS